MNRKPTHIRKEEIITTAMKIINEEGFPAFTMRKLSLAVGVSEPALYRHFDSKDDIVIGIIDKMQELWTETEKQLKVESEPIKQMQTFLRAHFSYIEKTPDIVAILFADEYIRRNELLSKHLERVQMLRFSYLLQKLTDAMAKGHFVEYNPQIMTVIMLGAVRAAVLNWVKADYSFSLAEAGEKVISTFTMILDPQKNNR